MPPRSRWPADLAPPPAALRRRLLDWYRRAARDLPWRRTRDPYLVWVSEVMLQQTTVRTAAPYYERFAQAWPAVDALAAAREEDVLAAWSGLGYYHRARNLLRGARHVMAHHEGRFPSTLEAALAVPGVGLYTASAILSIAHGKALPVVDGNVRRVLARLYALRGAQWQKDAPYYNLADEVLDRSSPGDWNQAVMELGATICLPRKPACPVCPLRASCRAAAEGVAEELPEKRARRAPVEVTVAAALLEQDGRFLLVRRGEGRLMGRMWEVPQTSLEGRGLPDLVPEMLRRHGLHVVPGALLGCGRHAITYRRIRVETYRTRLRGRTPDDAERFRWVTPGELAGLPISSLTRKVIASARHAQMPLALSGAR